LFVCVQQDRERKKKEFNVQLQEKKKVDKLKRKCSEEDDFRSDEVEVEGEEEQIRLSY
jgi:hypothetical protein